MEAVWLAAVRTVRQVLKQAAVSPEAVLAIGLTGQGDGTWPVDAQERSVRPAILWSDGRTADLVQELWAGGVGHALFGITGTALNTCNQAMHLRWLQSHEPETLERTAAVLRAKDWLFLRMTGEISTDITDASHTYFNAQTQQFDARVLTLLGIEAWQPKLPPIYPPHQNRAPLRLAAAELLGLPVGLPVVAGPFDVAASALGVGAFAPGHACSVLGTAGVHQIVTDAPIFEPVDIGYNMCHAPEGVLIRLLPTMTCTQNVRWFAQEFYAHEWAEAQRTGTNIWELLEQIAQQEPPGARGVMYHPYLDPAGERAPFIEPRARAQFSGLSALHTRATLLRAVYEGVALSVLDCYETMAAPVQALRLAGGGARSRLWAQMLADALAVPVLVAEGSEHGARGAAINAAVATGLYTSYDEAIKHMVHTAQMIESTEGQRSWWLEQLHLYRLERMAMTPVWKQRNKLAINAM